MADQELCAKCGCDLKLPRNGCNCTACINRRMETKLWQDRRSSLVGHKASSKAGRTRPYRPTPKVVQ